MQFLKSPKSILVRTGGDDSQQSFNQVSLQVSAPETKTQYTFELPNLTDMTTHWAREEAQFVTSLGLISVQEKNNQLVFEPADTVSRLDAAKMIVDGTFSQETGVANICTGQGRSVKKLAQEIASIYGREDLLNFGARPDNLVDPPTIIGQPTIFQPRLT